MRGAVLFLRLGLVAALAAFLSGCGDSPTGPNMATVDLSGNWSGTWTFTAAGVVVTDNVTVSLSQSGATATGTWTATGGASGQLNFQATAMVSGSLTISQPALGAPPCTATTTVQGSASTNRLDLALADIPRQGFCQWGTGSGFVLTR